MRVNARRREIEEREALSERKRVACASDRQTDRERERERKREREREMEYEPHLNRFNRPNLSKEDG